MQINHRQRWDRSLSVETPYGIGRHLHLRALSVARAMRFWLSRATVKHLTIAAMFAAALIGAPSAAQAQSLRTIDLRTLDGSNGFRINRGGTSTSNAGDVNGDGIDDVIIGTLGRQAVPSFNITAQPAETYVVFGQNGGSAPTLDVSTLDGTNGFVITDPNPALGYSVSGAGDVNGDGVDDLILGASSYRLDGSSRSGPDDGASYVLFGQSGGFSPTLNLNTLDGNNGFQINGFAPFEYGGQSVSGAGDVNGDGLDDVIVGAPTGYDFSQPNAPENGSSYLIFGQSNGFAASVDINSLDGTNGFAINGAASGDRSGSTVSDVGDFNGDGFDDIIVGNQASWPSASGAHVLFGQAGGFSPTLDLNSIDGSNGFAIQNATFFEAYSGLGEPIHFSGAGDVNGDGFDDIIVGGQGESSIDNPNDFFGENGYESGRSFVVFGSESTSSGVFDLTTLDGSNGFVINGTRPFNRTGRVVNDAGDVNGDGFDDLLIGGRDNDETLSYLVFGSDSGFPSIDLDTLDGDNGVALGLYYFDDVLPGVGAYALSGAGDINNDGFDDLILDGRVLFGRESFAIPEPSSSALLGAGLLTWLTRRRRK